MDILYFIIFLNKLFSQNFYFVIYSINFSFFKIKSQNQVFLIKVNPIYEAIKTLVKNINNNINIISF
jgi:hypothetical protein